MFKYKSVIKGISGLHRDRRNLPVDFGAMYFLFPPENINFFGFKSPGRVERLVNAVKCRFKKSGDDIDYYKNSSIC